MNTRGMRSAAHRIVQVAPVAQLTLHVCEQVTWQLLPCAHDTLPLTPRPTLHIVSGSHDTLHESTQLPVQSERAPQSSEQLVGPHVMGLKLHIESDGHVQLLPLQFSCTVPLLHATLSKPKQRSMRPMDRYYRDGGAC